MLDSTRVVARKKPLTLFAARLVATLHRVARMDSREEREAQLNRPVRDAGPRRSGPPASIYIFAVVLILAVISGILGMSGLFPGWIVAGVLVVGAGLVLVVGMIRRNRGSA